jgi:hypothetical protein
VSTRESNLGSYPDYQTRPRAHAGPQDPRPDAAYRRGRTLVPVRLWQAACFPTSRPFPGRGTRTGSRTGSLTLRTRRGVELHIKGGRHYRRTRPPPPGPAPARPIIPDGQPGCPVQGLAGTAAHSRYRSATALSAVAADRSDGVLSAPPRRQPRAKSGDARHYLTRRRRHSSLCFMAYTCYMRKDCR